LLFRDADVGRPKALAAADGAQRLNPDIEAYPVEGDFRETIGLGVYRRVDAVIGCLDSREGRLALNRSCHRVNKPWIDGALHALLGEERLFWPGRGACYECTMTPADYQIIGARYSCQAIRRQFVLEQKVPTTPTIAAIIAATQVQDAVKIIHGLPVSPGVAMVFNGLINDSYTVQLTTKKECMSHEIYAPIEEHHDLTRDLTVRELLQRCRQRTGLDFTLELDFDLVVSLECSCPSGTVDILKPSLQVTDRDLPCPHCRESRVPVFSHTLNGSESYADRSLASLGIRPLDVVVLRTANQLVYLEMTGDLAGVSFLNRRRTAGR
jgi:molybdopterin/thiamine biosynthesis adenylyltransferase